jgi:(1->4)-alpha-D-glucan 1-alpha-D-glucosylmutase
MPADRNPAPPLLRPAPTSTYRVQLTPDFGFAAAAEVLPYLAALGVSHLYCSPWLAASSGSRHGYDVIDHALINPELGGRQGLERLRAACDAAGLSIVLDIVPNHASVAAPESANAAWWEVLRDGPQSRFASWFDIDWDSPDNPGKILVPILGRPIAECLEAGEFVASRERLRYFDHVLPLAAGTQELPLEELLEAQHWRLCFWKVGSEELNYRRFFDVTTLAGLRVEDPDVFAATHREILASVADGTVSGLRVDHPDGLSDPKAYLSRLSEASRGCWIVVEKILESSEQLPADWVCHGTTGYDTLNRLTGVFVDPAGEEPLTRLYDEITETAQRWPVIAVDGKRQVLSTVLSAELNRLTELATRAAWALPRYRDLTRRAIREALAELLTQFDVYRAYMRPGERPDAEATAVLSRARDAAIRARPDRSDEIEAVCDLVVQGPDALVVRFAQTSGPVMAKGVEDTAFYRYGRLLALNEVGGDPSRFGVPVADFHAWATQIQQHRPLTMTTLSTHDTKRSEDVRARLVLLSEDVRRWQRVVTRLMNQAQKYTGPAGPEPATQYLVFQTLVGAFPIDEERLGAYLAKAIREAKLHTSWTAPDEAYEEAVQSYVSGVLNDRTIMTAAEQYVGELEEPGRVNSLAMKLLQLTMPGIPDTYQGSELWDLSLVDPDNRRRVDFGERARMVATMDRSDASLPRVDDTGAAKLHLVRSALRLRRDQPELFDPASEYVPLQITGSAAEHVVAFSRGPVGQPERRMVTVVPRLVLGLQQSGGWKDTAVELPAGQWTDVITGRRHGGLHGEATGAYLLKLLRDFPVALLVAGEAAGD